MFELFKRKSRNETPGSPSLSKAIPKSGDEIMAEVSDAIKRALRTGDPDRIGKTLRSVYETHRASEGPAGWIAGVIGEKGMLPLFGLVEDFVNRFPDSLCSVRVQWADYLAGHGNFDEAAEHARTYLRLASESDSLSRLGGLRVIRDGVGRAFSILVPAYAILGARNYAKRFLRYALTLDVAEPWKAEYRHQIARLDEALNDPGEKALDDKWEAFFESAFHAAELFTLCGEKGFPRMAARVDVIQTCLLYDSDFKVDEAELFLLIRQVETADGKSGKALI